MSHRRPQRDLANLSASDVAGALGADSVVVLPIGAIEQHGPHLPLSTDYLTVDALACEVVAGRGDELDLWLLPTIAYGKSNEHTWAAGTMSLETSTVLALLDDLARSLTATKVRKLAILNGHGGNSALLDVACRDLHVRHRLLTFLLHTVLPPDQGGPSAQEELHLGIHAGRDETSIVLHLAPELVHLERASRSIPEWLNEYRYVGIDGPVRFGWRADELAPSGVLGDPHLATAEHGKELFSSMVDDVGNQLEEISRFELGGTR
jgi:creatinine amidohydrolase